MTAVAVVATVWTPGSAVAAPVGDPAPQPLYDLFDDGDLAGWQITDGNWDVRSDNGRGYVQGSGLLEVAGSAGWSDYAISTTYETGFGSAVGARIQPDGSHYRLRTVSGGLSIDYVAADGAVESLASAGFSGGSNWQPLSLSVKGDLLIGRVPTTPVVFSVRDSRLSTGAAGLLWGSMDHAVVDTYETPAPGVPDTHRPQYMPAWPGAVPDGPDFASISFGPVIDDTAVTDYVIYRSGYPLDPSVPVAVVPAAGTYRVPLDTTRAMSGFTVTARDAAGNESAHSWANGVPLTPSFEKVPGDTIRPSAPGLPTVVPAPGGGWTVSWAPATDDVGVAEYHVTLTPWETGASIVRTTATSVTVPPMTTQSLRVSVTAFDASWNRTDGPTRQVF